MAKTASSTAAPSRVSTRVKTASAKAKAAAAATVPMSATSGVKKSAPNNNTRSTKRNTTGKAKASSSKATTAPKKQNKTASAGGRKIAKPTAPSSKVTKTGKPSSGASKKKTTATAAKKSAASATAPSSNTAAGTKRKAAANDNVPRPAKARKRLPIINEAPTQRLELFVIGCGDMGDLGLGPKVEDAFRITRNPLLDPDTVGIVDYSVGGLHTAAITHDHRVMTWGVNDEHALGRNTDLMEELDEDVDDDTGLNPKETTPAYVVSDEFHEGIQFVSTAASDNATFAITDEGLVYGWGTFRDHMGIKGFRPGIEVATTPMLIPELKNIKKIVCGSNHALALDSKGNVFVWGVGQNNELGRRIVERTRKLNLKPRILKSNIRTIGCGSNHSFLVDHRDQVWSFGANNYGQCGTAAGVGSDDECMVETPTIMPSLSNRGITHITGGRMHSVALTESHDGLVWGRVDHGQLGVDPSAMPAEDVVFEDGKARALTSPMTLPGIDCRHITAGGDSTFAIATDGQAFACGSGSCYQHGQGHHVDVTTVTPVVCQERNDASFLLAGIGGQSVVLAAVPA